MTQYDNEESKFYWVLRRWDKIPSISIGTEAWTCKIYAYDISHLNKTLVQDWNSFLYDVRVPRFHRKDSRA